MLKRLTDALAKSRARLAQGFEGFFKGQTRLPADWANSVEELLIGADLGTKAVSQILENLRKDLKPESVVDLAALMIRLEGQIAELLAPFSASVQFSADPPTVVFVVGVNGVGKTTTLAKLAARFQREGRSVLLAAADTFRAAAADQLDIWAKRLGAPLVRHQDGSDPAAVVFDAITAAQARHLQMVLVDTAGRLHTKSNLMEELKKIRRVAERAKAGAPHETLLVLDATTGQNGLAQARQFHEAVGLTGVVVTKLDGTARGGIAVAIATELGLPIKFIGVGEGIEDLDPFSAEAYAKALVAAPGPIRTS